MTALVRLFRHRSRGGSYLLSHTLEEDAATFVETWSHCSRLGKFRLRSKLIGKLLLKHLIQADAQGDTLIGKGRALTHKELVGLKLPDDAQVLRNISVYNRKKGQLQSTFSCHPLYLTHFAALARRVLRQNPVALAYTENMDNHPRIKEILDQHHEKHPSNPSLPHLYKLLLADSFMPGSPEASSSDEEEGPAEPQPAVRNQTQSTQRITKAGQPKKQAAPASRSRSPKKTVARSRKRNSPAAEVRLPASQGDPDKDRAISSRSSSSRPRWGKGTVVPATDVHKTD